MVTGEADMTTLDPLCYARNVLMAAIGHLIKLSSKIDFFPQKAHTVILWFLSKR